VTVAATKSKSAPSANGSEAPSTAAKAKDAGDSIATAGRRAKAPMLAAGATAAGLAGGLALGSRMASKRRGLSALFTPKRKVLGVPFGRKSNVLRTAEALGQVARELRSSRNQASMTTDDVRQIREQLDKANRQSPLEVVLDGLTHRRGAHKRES
jgi:hypothetical protein